MILFLKSLSMMLVKYRRFEECYMSQIFDNSPKPQREAYLWHYNIFGKALEKKISEFAKKYGLLINRD